jgi:hypothetical protein
MPDIAIQLWHKITRKKIKKIGAILNHFKNRMFEVYQHGFMLVVLRVKEKIPLILQRGYFFKQLPDNFPISRPCLPIFLPGALTGKKL